MKAVANQPVFVAIDAHGMQLYLIGMYDGPCGTNNLNHEVTLVGYGTDEGGTEDWIAKNSWGTAWGDLLSPLRSSPSWLPLKRFLSRSSGSSSSLPWSTTSSFVRVMDGATDITTEAEVRPKVVGRAGNPEATAVNSFLRVITPVGTKVFMALVVMRSCHDYDSIVTVQCLAKVRQRFFIPREYELHVLLPGQRPYDELCGAVA
ncbi:hypothetical protein BHM03_00021099 [Ensete ventricosum]|uniref:Peptidase C1A papain C-terminal domain-containing protein n=1 Tax=Ensete ventricosum TaxID=4639 RepID=A0A445MG23_ENSVE|nr:hypothetical protein BHM03_00021099 [Ensete ventricosum]